MTFPVGLRAFNHRDFRIYFVGQSIALIGTWMQQVAQAWLVLQLTNSPFKLGVVGTLNFAPALFLSLVAGAVVDRVPRRRLLLATQSVMAVQTLTLAVLIATGHIQYWHVCVMALVWGVANAIEMPARLSFVLELVGRADLANGIAINAAAFNTARVVGPALAGILIAAVGVAPAFFINAATFLVVIPALVVVRPHHVPAPRSATTIVQEIREGVRYAVQTPRIRVALSILFVVAITVFNFSVYVPLFARDVLGRGPDGFGFLMASLGVGSVGGALSFIALRDRQPPLGALFGAGFVASAGMAALSLIRSFGLAAVGLFIIGYASVFVVVGCNATLQLTTPDALRGRVMSLHTLLFAGMVPFGVFFVGFISEHWGVPTALAASGTLGVVALLVLLARARGA